MLESARTFAGPRLAGLLAFAVPATYAVLHAAPYAQLGEAAAFAAPMLEAPRTTAELWARACSLVPLGSLGFRASLASAFWLGLLAATTYRAIDTLLRAQGVLHRVLRPTASLGACWLAVGSTPLLERGLAPGAAVCTAALVMVVLAELQALWLAPEQLDRGGKRLALGLGLLLAQDSAAFVVVVLAAIPGTLRLAPRASRRAVVTAGAALGGGTLLALAGAPGDASATVELAPSFATIRALLEHAPHLAAGAFLGSVAVAQTRAPRAADGATQARLRAVRASGLTWALPFFALAALGAQSGDPLEAVPIAALVVLPIAAVLTAALGGTLAAPDGAHSETAALPQLALAGAMLAAGAWQFPSAAVSGRATFALPDAWAATSIERFPPRALVLARDRERAALAAAVHAETRARPDLQLVAIADLAQPAYARAIAASPSLRPLVRSYLLQGELTRAELESRTADRPVLLDQPSAPELRAALRPESLWYEVAGARVPRSEERSAGEEYDARMERLAREGEGADESPRGRAFLARLDLVAARYFASHRDGEHAEAARRRGRERMPAWPAWNTIADTAELSLRQP